MTTIEGVVTKIECEGDSIKITLNGKREYNIKSEWEVRDMDYTDAVRDLIMGATTIYKKFEEIWSSLENKS